MDIYAPHYSSNDDTYYRVATNPHDGNSWGSEQSYNWKTIPGPTRPTETQDLSYTNVCYLTGEGTGQGRLYNLSRVFTRTPNLSYSDDLGQTWNYMGRLNSPVGGATYSNFYHKIADNGVDRIDFIGTEQHPRNYNNNVYHGYIKNGKSYNSFGVEKDTINDACAPSVQAFTPVFTADPTQGAGTYHTGWTNEIELDKNGYPVCLFQTRYGTSTYGDGSGQQTRGAGDHRFFYGRFNGSSWTITELCKMGTGMHTPEQDYIGMGCINPDDVNEIYVSTPFDPNGAALSHREIFKGVTSNNGLNWNWTRITIDSTVDNIRPAIPRKHDNNKAVFWTRGAYPGQENFDFVLVGMVEEANATVGLVSYTDASTSNTTNADGSAFSPTGPSGSPGTADSRWHQYTGYGNGGSCFTAGDGGTENVPTIKTTLTGLADGTYDVFAYFWCDPAQDWGIRGGFASDVNSMLCFNKQSSQCAETSQFSGSVTVVSGAYQLYRVYIGRKVVSGGTPVVVYLDNYDSTYTTNAPTRTTYDGVGVASVSSGAPPGAASAPSPANGATNIDVNAVLSWTAGSGATSHDVNFGTTSPPPFIVNQGPNSFDPCGAGPMSYNTTYYWRINEKNAGGTTAGVIWSFTTAPAPPGQATNPSPANGATNIDVNAVLSWTAGPNTTSHDVNFGTTSPPPFIVNQGPNSFDPCGAGPMSTIRLITGVSMRRTLAARLQA